MSRIHGYSERGVVNAVFETIAAHPDGTELLADLLERLVLWENRGGVCRLSTSNRRLIDFEIYIEPSLSDFGDPDVLVFADFQNPDDNSLWRETFFIEAKVEPFLMSSPLTEEELDSTDQRTNGHESDPFQPPDPRLLAEFLTDCDFGGFLSRPSNDIKNLWRAILGHTLPDPEFYRKNASTILHELFLKYRFWETHLATLTDEQLARNRTVAIKAYSGQDPDRQRSVGSDPVVLRLVRRLRERGSMARFVSLTTDPPPAPEFTEGRSWPLGMAVASRFLKMSEWNDSDLGWTPGNPRGAWYELSYLMSWFDVYDWAGRHALGRVQESLTANEEKFTFWPRCAGNGIDDLLTILRERDPDGQWINKDRVHPWRTALHRNGRACLFVDLVVGFTSGYRIQVESKQTNVLKALVTKGLPPRFLMVRSPQHDLMPDSDGCLDCVMEALQADPTMSWNARKGE